MNSAHLLYALVFSRRHCGIIGSATNSSTRNHCRLRKGVHGENVFLERVTTIIALPYALHTRSLSIAAGSATVAAPLLGAFELLRE